METPMLDIPSGVFEKEQERRELERLTEEFLKRGGRIRVIEGEQSGKKKVKGS
jgi:hypothetical protein